MDQKIQAPIGSMDQLVDRVLWLTVIAQASAPILMLATLRRNLQLVHFEAALTSIPLAAMVVLLQAPMKMRFWIFLIKLDPIVTPRLVQLETQLPSEIFVGLL
jgi:hypothetical protein